LHVKVQEPPTQAGAALASAVVHGWLHDPQWATLVISSTQVALHRSGVPEGQPDTQVLPTQTGVDPVQAVPQAAQWLALLVKSTQVVPQRVSPAPQAGASGAELPSSPLS
jgi:hypothetical protein